MAMKFGLSVEIQLPAGLSDFLIGVDDVVQLP